MKFTRPSVLQEMKVRILPHGKCEKSSVGTGMKISTPHICVVGKAGTKACDGDSGGPLTIKVNIETRTIFIVRKSLLGSQKLIN